MRAVEAIQRHPPSPKGDGLDAELLDVTRVAKTPLRTQASYTLQLEVPDSLREALKEKDIVAARCPKGDRGT